MLLEKPHSKQSLGSLRRKWEGNMKFDLKETGYENSNWIEMAQIILMVGFGVINVDYQR
jgi:hypothetical protein